ncbi:MAG: 50S ribosomal protein L11 methyltransferase [Bacteroidetes bacterium]|nr:50S ribosomal protein L11 methyltransferase [Bacteroidota bacterium]
MKDKYFEIRISFGKSNYEEIMNQLYMEGVENILEENGQIILNMPEDAKEELDSLIKTLVLSGSVKKKDITSELLENKNWNHEWERSVEPVYISDKMIIYPSWKKDELKDHEGKILIEIDPKMSFGTGHNETTQLVLELMSEYLEGSEQYLFDFGCGTGILSIAGIKLGVKKALAVDIDADSIANAKEYAKINNVHKNIKFVNGSLEAGGDEIYDIVCANIIRSVILENIERISGMMKKGSKLFLSGILISEDQDILEHLVQYDFEIIDMQVSSEWIGIYAVRV